MKRDLSSGTLNRLHEHGQDELARLFILHRVQLQRLITSRLNKVLLPRLDASDIVQEVFIRARKRLDDYLASPRIHPIVWLRVLCRDLIAETARKQCRDKRNPAREIPLYDNELLVERFAGSTTSAGTTLAKAELANRVAEAISELRETDREIIEMRHSEGMSFQEIANQLEMKMEAAKKRYYRAINRISDSLGNINE